MSTNFSVIIPIYNGEKYLREAIDSVLKQSMLPKEIILVDDGSTDGSWQICENYKKEYPIIKSVHKKNGGVSSARNLGMEYATLYFWIVTIGFLKKQLLHFMNALKEIKVRIS